MSRLVLGYHAILTAYGFWLPNDPRGSWSDFVRAWELLKFGAPTKVNHRRSVAQQPHDRARRLAAKKALSHRPVHFSGIQARAIGTGFAQYARRNRCAIHACSILPTHVHLVIGRESRDIRQVARLLKGAATTALIEAGLHPFAEQPYRNGRLPTQWTRHEWVCFLFSTEDIVRAITYVERNPLKDRMPVQQWNCVTRFDPEVFRFL